jgi:hypothetical protein
MRLMMKMISPDVDHLMATTSTRRITSSPSAYVTKLAIHWIVYHDLKLVRKMWYSRYYRYAGLHNERIRRHGNHFAQQEFY